MPSNAASPSPPVLGQPTEAGAVSASKPDTHLVTALAPLVRALARLVSLELVRTSDLDRNRESQKKAPRQ